MRLSENLADLHPLLVQSLPLVLEGNQMFLSEKNDQDLGVQPVQSCTLQQRGVDNVQQLSLPPSSLTGYQASLSLLLPTKRSED